MSKQKIYYIKLERLGKIQLCEHIEIWGVKQYSTFDEMWKDSKSSLVTVLRCRKCSKFISIYIGVDL